VPKTVPKSGRGADGFPWPLLHGLSIGLVQNEKIGAIAIENVSDDLSNYSDMLGRFPLKKHELQTER
jgi:hypothetical protein